MQEHHSLNNTNSQDDRLNIREQLDKYVIHWKWFLLSIVICLIAAFLYLRYTVPQYSASATILVKDERKGGIQSELSAFSDLGLVKSLKNNVDNEIEIIKSRNIISAALKKLNLNVEYYTEGRVKLVELYDESPIRIKFTETSNKFNDKNFKYEIVYNS